MIEPNKPFLSVVIPTYNRKESLRVTLDGLARQTYPTDSIEVLVISDGSTDGTETLLRQYRAQLPYPLRVLLQANSGPSRARNRGVREARGEVIVFLDDDVEPEPGFLAAHAAHHERDGAVAVFGPMAPDPRRRRAEPVWIAWEHAMLERQYTSWRTGIWAEAGPHNFYTGNASVRRAHVLAVGGFDESFKRQEDVEMACRMSRVCGVRFVFEASARGLHRPARSLAAWLSIPYAYGQIDVVRARRGDASWEIVRQGYYRRSRLTRLLHAFTSACPGAAGLVRALLRAGAGVCHRARLPRLSLGALSALYNLRYLEGARDALGPRRDLARLLKAAPTEPVPAASCRVEEMEWMP